MCRAEDIQARLREKPFRPLRIIASEGLQYDVHHPDLVFVGRHDPHGRLSWARQSHDLQSRHSSGARAHCCSGGLAGLFDAGEWAAVTRPWRA